MSTVCFLTVRSLNMFEEGGWRGPLYRGVSAGTLYMENRIRDKYNLTHYLSVTLLVGGNKQMDYEK